MALFWKRWWILKINKYANLEIAFKLKENSMRIYLKWWICRRNIREKKIGMNTNNNNKRKKNYKYIIRLSTGKFKIFLILRREGHQRHLNIIFGVFATQFFSTIFSLRRHRWLCHTEIPFECELTSLKAITYSSCSVLLLMTVSILLLL